MFRVFCFIVNIRVYEFQILRRFLDLGHRLPLPQAVLINGRANWTTFTVEQGLLFVFLFLSMLFVFLINWNISASKLTFYILTGKTYRLRISNVGLENTLNFRIQDHTMKLVEVEGTHTLQTSYSSIDVHVGQSYSVLITADQAPKDFHIVASTRFTEKILTSTAVLHYSNSQGSLSDVIPGGPTEIDWSIQQARSIR